MARRPSPVSGPVEIVDRALEHVRRNLAAAFFLGFAPNLIFAEAVFGAVVRAPQIVASPGRLLLVSTAFALGFLLKGVFVAAQLIHADAALDGAPRTPGSCLSAALRRAPRALAARALWVVLLVLGLATGLLLPLLPIAVLASRRSLGESRRLVGRVLLRPSRPMGEGWSKVPALQLFLFAIFLFLAANFAALEGLAAYLVSGLPGHWQNLRASLSPVGAPGACAAVLAALSFLGPVAVAAERFLEEDVEGRVTGRDLGARLAGLGA